MERHYHGQMSDSFLVGALLSFTGGFQDAYTYLTRGKVFANAQTGNIVLMGQNLALLDWEHTIRYAIPILSFVAGIFLAQKVRYRFQENKRLHWRQLILAFEILALFIVAFLPAELNSLANALVSFACAMQVDSFRKIRGNSLATTMCIGNLRTATDLMCAYRATGDKRLKTKGLHAYVTILVFALGATLGKFACDAFSFYAIWICCVGLLAAFLIMFIHDEFPEELQRHETLRDELRDVVNALRRKHA